MTLIALITATVLTLPSSLQSSVIVHTEAPRMSIDLRAGPFTPRLNSKAARSLFKVMYAGAYKNLGPLLLQVDADFWMNRFSQKGVYLVGLSWGAGYWGANGKARVCGLDPCTTPQSVATSTDGNSSTRLSILPITTGVVGRLELLRQWGIPLTLHARAGLNYTLYWASTDGKTARVVTPEIPATSDSPAIPARNQKFSGGLLGLQGSIGLGLNLDWLDPSTGHGGAYLAGTQLVAEVGGVWANSFAQSNRFDASNRKILVQVGLVLDLR